MTCEVQVCAGAVILANAVPPGIYRGKYAIFDLSVNVWESGEKDW